MDIYTAQNTHDIKIIKQVLDPEQRHQYVIETVDDFIRNEGYTVLPLFLGIFDTYASFENWLTISGYELDKMKVGSHFIVLNNERGGVGEKGVTLYTLGTSKKESKIKCQK